MSIVDLRARLADVPGIETLTMQLITATKTEFNREPIRLTFDASRAATGARYSHLVDVWGRSSLLAE